MRTDVRITNSDRVERVRQNAVVAISSSSSSLSCTCVCIFVMSPGRNAMPRNFPSCNLYQCQCCSRACGLQTIRKQKQTAGWEQLWSCHNKRTFVTSPHPHRAEESTNSLVKGQIFFYLFLVPTNPTRCVCVSRGLKWNSRATFCLFFKYLLCIIV